MKNLVLLVILSSLCFIAFYTKKIVSRTQQSVWKLEKVMAAQIRHNHLLKAELSYLSRPQNIVSLARRVDSFMIVSAVQMNINHSNVKFQTYSDDKWQYKAYSVSSK
jgi:hypothetical protein